MNERALELRREFDRSFAEPPRDGREPVADVLAIRVGGDAWALRMEHLSHLASGRKVVPVPSRRPELLGVATVRGVLVPVFSLARLLGYAAPPGAPRWLAACGAGPDAAFAFDVFERYLRVPAAAFSRADTRRPHVEELVREGETVRTVVHLPSILGAMTRHGGTA